MKSRFNSITYILLLSLLLCLISFETHAQLNALPVSAQAIIFKKVFSYLKAFQKTEKIKLLILYDNNTESEKNNIISAFKNEKINAVPCRIDQLSANIKDASAVYVPKEFSGSSIKTSCKKYKVLSITGDPELVMKGDVSIGIGNASKNEPGKKIKLTPKIILNLTQLQNEAQEVTELLSLDSIIKVK